MRRDSVSAAAKPARAISPENAEAIAKGWDATAEITRQHEDMTATAAFKTCAHQLRLAAGLPVASQDRLGCMIFRFLSLIASYVAFACYYGLAVALYADESHTTGGCCRESLDKISHMVECAASARGSLTGISVSDLPETVRS